MRGFWILLVALLACLAPAKKFTWRTELVHARRLIGNLVASPSATPSPSGSNSPTATCSSTSSETGTATSSSTASVTVSSTGSATPPTTGTQTASVTASVTASRTNTPTVSPTPSNSFSNTPDPSSFEYPSTVSVRVVALGHTGNLEGSVEELGAAIRCDLMNSLSLDLTSIRVSSYTFNSTDAVSGVSVQDTYTDIDKDTSMNVGTCASPPARRRLLSGWEGRTLALAAGRAQLAFQIDIDPIRFLVPLATQQPSPSPDLRVTTMPDNSFVYSVSKDIWDRLLALTRDAPRLVAVFNASLIILAGAEHTTPAEASLYFWMDSPVLSSQAWQLQYLPVQEPSNVAAAAGGAAGGFIFVAAICVIALLYVGHQKKKKKEAEIARKAEEARIAAEEEAERIEMERQRQLEADEKRRRFEAEMAALEALAVAEEARAAEEREKARREAEEEEAARVAAELAAVKVSSPRWENGKLVGGSSSSELLDIMPFRGNYRSSTIVSADAARATAVMAVSDAHAPSARSLSSLEADGQPAHTAVSVSYSTAGLPVPAYTSHPVPYGHVGMSSTMASSNGDESPYVPLGVITRNVAPAPPVTERDKLPPFPTVRHEAQYGSSNPHHARAPSGTAWAAAAPTSDTVVTVASGSASVAGGSLSGSPGLAATHQAPSARSQLPPPTTTQSNTPARAAEAPIVLAEAEGVVGGGEGEEVHPLAVKQEPAARRSSVVKKKGKHVVQAYVVDDDEEEVAAKAPGHIVRKQEGTAVLPSAAPPPETHQLPGAVSRASTESKAARAGFKGATASSVEDVNSVHNDDDLF